MNLLIITTSHREASASCRVARHIRATLAADTQVAHAELVDLAVNPLAFFDPARSTSEKRDHAAFFEAIRAADGVVLVTPEWDGMASPAAKNLMLYLHEGEVAHKPGLLVSVSGGANGAYPIAELRASSYKNSFINWIPLHLIVRAAQFQGETFDPTGWAPYESTLRVFLAYCRTLAPARAQLSELMSGLSYGM